MNKRIHYDIRQVEIREVSSLFKRFHKYSSHGDVCVYAFAVYENDAPVAAFIWNTPAPGVSKALSDEPSSVLSLSRMVAVPKTERALVHISKPLRYQMHNLLDRTRWPVLVTFSDITAGHTGHVYKCSGWRKTTVSRVKMVTRNGERVSIYNNGKMVSHVGASVEYGFIQRWEHSVCDQFKAREFMEANGWRKRESVGREWKNGSARFRFEKEGTMTPQRKEF